MRTSTSTNNRIDVLYRSVVLQYAEGAFVTGRLTIVETRCGSLDTVSRDTYNLNVLYRDRLAHKTLPRFLMEPQRQSVAEAAG